MSLTVDSARATLGLSASCTLTRSGTTGSMIVGGSNQNLRLTAATQPYSILAVFAASGNSFDIDFDTNNVAASTTWVAGTAQVETATAAGTITTAGNATVTVTSTGMTGSPLAISVAVALTDTAATWAGKVRTALAANATIAARFVVSGTTTAIVLTRKPTVTYTVTDGTLSIYAANDASLNIALADDTSAGITEAATSANTTAGVASNGMMLYDANGSDIDTNPIILTSTQGISFSVTGTGGVTIAGDTLINLPLAPNSSVVMASTTEVYMEDLYVLTATGGSCALAITVVGS